MIRGSYCFDCIAAGATLFVMVACGCERNSHPGTNADGINVYTDKEFTSMYMPNRGGVTSADGTISFVLDDGSSIFMTGDAFVGDVYANRRSTSDKMINNAFVHISSDAKYLGAYYGGTKESPSSLCYPLEAETSAVKFWYWPGHGFQEGNRIYAFMTKFYQGGEGMWGFVFAGTDLVIFDEDYKVLSRKELFDRNCPVHWGHSVMKDGEYYYVYGTGGNGGMYVYRTQMAGGILAAPEFYSDGNWASDSVPTVCSGITVPVSEQFSVFRHGDNYILLTMKRESQSGEIYSFVARSPEGPWENEKMLYRTKEQDCDKNLFTYNAMAHPQFINNRNELLICYNVNSFDVPQIFSQVSAYRPVFLRVPMSMIEE